MNTSKCGLLYECLKRKKYEPYFLKNKEGWEIGYLGWFIYTVRLLLTISQMPYIGMQSPLLQGLWLTVTLVKLPRTHVLKFPSSLQHGYLLHWSKVVDSRDFVSKANWALHSQLQRTEKKLFNSLTFIHTRIFFVVFGFNCHS
jgi:hypothetical protein